jgi:hypothetical protein
MTNASEKAQDFGSTKSKTNSSFKTAMFKITRPHVFWISDFEFGSAYAGLGLRH